MDRAEAIKRLEWLATVGGVVNSCTIGGEDMDALNMAIAALRGAGAEGAGCEYCNVPLYMKVKQYAKPILAPLTPAQELRDKLLDMTGETYIQSPKKFCHMCGRKLGGAEG